MAIDSASSASLAPGFRFHPTDEELVRYYLRRKVCGKPFRFDAISDVDVYKVEPWDLPGLSRLKSRDLEWYFFSVLDKKYGNGSRTNRATDRGYWKTTGKDRHVYHKSQMVGMKKTLVYHSGRAPRGERTNWVMHEYRLIDQELESAGIVQDAFVLCRIFRKSGSGPKNGEQYGAPFIEEEWENDELVMVPKEESQSAEEVPVDDDDAYLDANDIALILGTDIPAEDVPLPLNFYCMNNDNFGEVNTETSDPQQFLVGLGENEPGVEQMHETNLFDLPVQNGLDAKSVKREYIGEPSSNVNSVDYLLDEPYLDATSDPLLDDGAFFGADDAALFEANELKKAMESDPGLDMVDEYFTYFDPATNNLQYTFDASVGSENLVPGSSSFAHEFVNEEDQQETAASQGLFEGQDINVASSSMQDPDFGKSIKYPSFFEKATHMLGKFSAPPAFASEFPTEEAALHLAKASPSSVHVTAGMIQLRNVGFSGSGVDWSLGKHGQVKIVLSFGLAQREDNSVIPQSTASLNSRKVDFTMSRSWLYSIFLWILALSMSFKIGTYICPKSFMS